MCGQNSMPMCELGRADALSPPYPQHCGMEPPFVWQGAALGHEVGAPVLQTRDVENPQRQQVLRGPGPQVLRQLQQSSGLDSAKPVCVSYITVRLAVLTNTCLPLIKCWRSRNTARSLRRLMFHNWGDPQKQMSSCTKGETVTSL